MCSTVAGHSSVGTVLYGHFIWREPVSSLRRAPQSTKGSCRGVSSLAFGPYSVTLASLFLPPSSSLPEKAPVQKHGAARLSHSASPSQSRSHFALKSCKPFSGPNRSSTLPPICPVLSLAFDTASIVATNIGSQKARLLQMISEAPTKASSSRQTDGSDDLGRNFCPPS